MGLYVAESCTPQSRITLINCHAFAYRELVKRLIPNFCIPQSAKPLGKAYAMVQGLKFTESDIELWDTVRKRLKLKDLRKLKGILSLEER